MKDEGGGSPPVSTSNSNSNSVSRSSTRTSARTSTTAVVELTRLGAFLALVGVALGAFGAHALKDRLSAAGLATYHTGTKYHLIHAVGILIVASLAGRVVPATRALLVGRLFAVGIVFFSGSLYALAVTGFRVLGAITPIGGVCFLGGWGLLAFSAHSAHVGRVD